MTDALDPCYTTALRILNYRFNSETELRRKLRAKQFDDVSIAATLERLRAENWIDDARFAGAFVRTRLRQRIGSRRILRELSEAGVDESIARAAVAELADPEHDRTAARAVAAKRLRTLARKEGDDKRQKLASYLVRQGFDTSLALEIARELT